jgi:uncharacterized membrane protein YhaH (DUF805 family)
VRTSTLQQAHIGTLFSFKGRTKRLPFALTALAILVLWQLPEPVVTTLLLYGVSMNATTFSTVLVLLACLAWPLSCVAARRLHDAGFTGWPGLIYLAHTAFALFAAIANRLSLPHPGPWIYNSISWLLVLTTLVLAVLSGSKGENRFGADPRQRSVKASDNF